VSDITAADTVMFQMLLFFMWVKSTVNKKTKMAGTKMLSSGRRFPVVLNKRFYSWLYN